MNYGELKSAVKGYLHRSDIDAMLPVWLALTEQRIYTGEANSPPLRIAAMDCKAILTSYTRPADFLEARLVHEYGCEDRRMDLRPLADLPVSRKAYAWDGQSIALSPDQSLPIGLHYTARFAPLENDADTNWLLTNAPNVYLSSMLVEAARWSRDDALGAREAANYASAVSALHDADKTAQHSGSRLTIKPVKGMP